MSTLESLRAETTRVRNETVLLRAEAERLRLANEEMKQQAHQARAHFDTVLQSWDALVAMQRAPEAYFEMRKLVLALLDVCSYK